MAHLWHSNVRHSNDNEIWPTHRRGSPSPRRASHETKNRGRKSVASTRVAAGHPL